MFRLHLNLCLSLCVFVEYIHELNEINIVLKLNANAVVQPFPKINRLICWLFLFPVEMWLNWSVDEVTDENWANMCLLFLFDDDDSGSGNDEHEHIFYFTIYTIPRVGVNERFLPTIHRMKYIYSKFNAIVGACHCSRLFDYFFLYLYRKYWI